MLKVPSVATRTVLAAPLELTLLPALHHEVTVLSEGRPVAGSACRRDGNRFPGSRVSRVETAKRGSGFPRRSRSPSWSPGTPRWVRAASETWRVALVRGRPSYRCSRRHRSTIRVVDVDGKPIGGVELGVSVRTEDSDWIVAAYIEASHVRTDADGTAIVPWAPREKLQYVDVDLLSPDWKIDETDLKQIKSGIITVHARREQTVQGRLIMPSGLDAEGILVTGFGFGPANIGDIPYARARRDGTFTLRVPSEHGFVLGIDDLKWASDPWTGMILGKDSAKPAEITMKVYPATPLTVRVTRGPQHDPVANAWVDLCSMGEVNWTDSYRQETNGNGRRSNAG